LLGFELRQDRHHEAAAAKLETQSVEKLGSDGKA